mmetsp:Transcript_22074/g.22262  ORF Transcript_22074/g.22262 Transcript_22074/m.22262 type:complete len:370 (-) Transcript_22074:389-1498(-)
MGCAVSVVGDNELARGRAAFESNYRMGETLGKGGFSVVRVGVEQSTGRKVAVKCTNRSDIQPEDEEAIRQEAEILIVLNHPNIVKCYNIYEDDKTFYVILEILKGGELFEKIVKKTFYSESDARDLVQLLLNAIKYFHEKGIVHRDLKPENLLLTSDADRSQVKIADFGLAAYDHGQNQLEGQCGSPHYIAPEILETKPYGAPVDMWALGVIAYNLLGGKEPFRAGDVPTLLDDIRHCKYDFEGDCWKSVSDEAKDLISRLLTLDVTKRLTANEAINHPWTQKDAKELAKRNLGENLRQFRENEKWEALRRKDQQVMAASQRRSMGTGGTRMSKVASSGFLIASAKHKKSETAPAFHHAVSQPTITHKR